MDRQHIDQVLHYGHIPLGEYGDLEHDPRLEMLGLMAGAMAHDINNLLQVISGNLALLARDLAEKNPAQLRIERAMMGVDLGTTLALNVLDFCKDRPDVVTPVDLDNELRHGVMAKLLQAVVGPGIHVEIAIAPDIWLVPMNLSQFHCTLMNLAINARDAMAGEGRIRVEAWNQPGSPRNPRSHVVVSVKDEGPGIDPTTLERIFDPFFTTKTNGTGLGLVAVQRFAKSTGAQITVFTEPGIGTIFTLHFPIWQES